MDRSLELLHLAEAEQHVARGAKHISDQELRVADIDGRGYDSALARDILETFRQIQVQHLAHRDRILRVLNQQHRVSSVIEAHHASPAPTHYYLPRAEHEAATNNLGAAAAHDPITDIVARKVIEVGATGISNPEEISKIAIKQLGFP